MPEPLTVSRPAIPCQDLRNGKLPREDQSRRDQLIGERFAAGETYEELSAAFLISHGTVWRAIKRAGVNLPSSKYGRGKHRRANGKFARPGVAHA